MSIATCIPQWLRLRFHRPVRKQQIIEIEKKAETLVQPAKPGQDPQPAAWQDDTSPPGYRVLWRQ